jgi:hypothetical protein
MIPVTFKMIKQLTTQVTSPLRRGSNLLRNYFKLKCRHLNTKMVPDFDIEITLYHFPHMTVQITNLSALLTH